jgi:hypothetical protein
VDDKGEWPARTLAIAGPADRPIFRRLALGGRPRQRQHVKVELAGRRVLAYLRDSFSSADEEVGQRNGTDDRRTMHGDRPHDQLTNAEKEQTGN